MNWVIYIGVMVAFSVALGAGWIAWATLAQKRNLAKFDNYDRNLSEKELAFLEQAQTDLKNAAEAKTPLWYKVFLYTGFFPAILLCWVLLAGMVWGLQQLMRAPEFQSNGLLFKTGGELEWAYLMGVFGGIFLAGALLYTVSLRKQALSNFIALNSNMYGFDKEAVRSGLIARLVHKIRTREQKTTAPFSANEFLRQVNISYRDGCMKWVYGCLIIAAFFAVFDLRSGVQFFDNEMIGTRAYFTVKPKQTFSYERISRVELDCFFKDGEPRATYAIFVDGKELVSLFLRQDRIAALGELNTVLRGQSQIKFEPRIDENGEVWLSSKCVDLLGAEWGEPELVGSVLSTDT